MIIYMQIHTKERVENIKQRKCWFMVKKFGVQDPIAS